MLLKEAAESWQKQLLDKTDDYLAKGELAAAVDYLKKSKGELPDRKILKTISTALDEKYTEVYGLWREDVKQSALRKAEEYATNQDYATALVYLKDGLSKIGDEEELTSMINTYEEAWRQIRIEEAVAEAKGLYEKGELEAAITVLNKAVDQLGSDPSMTALKDKYIDQYREAAIKKAEEIYEPFNEESILSAEGILKEALAFLSTDEKISKAIEKYIELEPIKILPGVDNLPPANGGDKWKFYGERSHYSVAMKGDGIWSSDTTRTITYDLSGNYSRFSGSFGFMYYSEGGSLPKIEIKTDDRIVLNELLKYKEDSIEFSIDLRGVQQLEITIYTCFLFGNSERPYGVLANAMFWK